MARSSSRATGRSTSRRSCCASTRPRRGCKMLAEESPAVFVAWDLLALGDEDLREVPAGRAARTARGRPRRGRTADPPDPGHARSRHGQPTGSSDFEGAGLDGVVAKRLDAPYQPGKRAMLKIKHQRTADCVVAGFRWHKNGPGTHVGSLLLGPVRRRGHAPPRRGHVVVHVGPARRARRGAGAAARERARGPSVARDGPSGRAGDSRGVRPAAPGRHVALEPRQGPVVGAAPRRARRRGRLRPPPGRPLPPRDHVQALAPGQAAERLPLRPARGDRALPAGPDLRRRD